MVYRVESNNAVQRAVRQAQIRGIDALGDEVALSVFLQIPGGLLHHGVIDVRAREVKSGKMLK